MRQRFRTGGTAVAVVVAAAVLGWTAVAPAQGQDLGWSIDPDVHTALRVDGENFRTAGPPVVRTGVVAGGAVILRLPVTFARTGVVAADTMRRGGLFSGPRIVAPAGAVMAHVRYTARLLNPSAPARTATLGAWCEAAPRADGRRGWCLVESRAGGGYMHASTAIGGRGLPPPDIVPEYRLVAEAQVRARPDLATAPMELRYTFREWDARNVDIAITLVRGDQTTDLGVIDLPRAPDGTARLESLGASLRLRVGAHDRTAIVEAAR